MATGVCIPVTTGAFEAHLEQTLAGGLDVAGADGETASSRHLMPLVFAMTFKIRDGLTHGATVPDAHGLLLAVPKWLEGESPSALCCSASPSSRCVSLLRTAP